MQDDFIRFFKCMLNFHPIFYSKDFQVLKIKQIFYFLQVFLSRKDPDLDPDPSKQMYGAGSE